ncbi:carcinoembryonic antigen-related cell adhesion molecule 16-like [Rana temporaria]|uniref:carcinoembryonic antigen-related cell adhesion molecule 16-like n=1 Tax=Rana temporaria TaxID=8407 RepID=UPI001AACD40A|nr:carcinoembryonic antigen-related cell adhesion molecule 16-like [Rana temporaria]
MIFKHHQFGPWAAVSVLLGVLVDVSGGMMSVQLIPQNPVTGGSVTMSATGITGRIQTFTWYKGPSVDREYEILTYTPGDKIPLIPGPLHWSRVTAFPNGSLQISNLDRTDEGNYRVLIQTDTQSLIVLYLKIYDMVHTPKASTSFPKESDAVTLTSPIVCKTTCPSGNELDGGKIAVIVIGTVIGIFILEVIVYFVLKKKKGKPSGSVYENENVSQQHNNEMTFPRSGVHPTQDSTYAQLSHKNRSIYSTIEPATGI